jgi:hypothetical protein
MTYHKFHMRSFDCITGTGLAAARLKFQRLDRWRLSD